MEIIRRSKYIDSENCSIVRIIDGEVWAYNTPLYVTTGNEIDYSKDRVVFYAKSNDGTGPGSLNQAYDAVYETPGGNATGGCIGVGLNTAWEIFQGFEWIEKENERRLQEFCKSSTHKLAAKSNR